MGAYGEVFACLLLGAVCAWGVGCCDGDENEVDWKQGKTPAGFPEFSVEGHAPNVVLTTAGAYNGVINAKVYDSNGNLTSSPQVGHAGQMDIDTGTDFGSIQLYRTGSNKAKVVTKEDLGL